MRDRRRIDELTIEELEQLLLTRRRQARAERIRDLAQDQGMGCELIASLKAEAEPEGAPLPEPTAEGRFHPISRPDGRKRRRRLNGAWLRDTSLLIFEIAALIGLVAVLGMSLLNMQAMRGDVALAGEPLPAPTATAQVQLEISAEAAVLPGGHSPPSVISDVPQRLAGLVEPVIAVPIPTPGPRSPTRIRIESIGVDAPVVEGDDWEQLKKGAGHHTGSANPGERGNTFISAHNDIFGEIFRDLDKVELEDIVVVYAGDTPYRYRVKAKRIVDPLDVSVMAPTANPVLTLMTCYPYMIDTHRLVLIAELVK